MDVSRSAPWACKQTERPFSDLLDTSAFLATVIRLMGPHGVLHIEVRGRAAVGSVALTRNEWIKAERFGDDYWLYIVVNCKTEPQLYVLRNPAAVLRPEEELEVVRYIVRAEAWQRIAERIDMTTQRSSEWSGSSNKLRSIEERTVYMNANTNRYRIPPACGERWAIGGYKPQYLTAVYLVVQKLRQGSLEEIRLADLEAGRVDDLLLFKRSGVLVALQIKAETGELSYADFVSSNDDSGLLPDLADGWRRLHRTHPDRELRIHFLTSQRPSTSTHGNIYLPKGNPPPSSPSFAAFLNEAWVPYKEALTRNAPFTLPASWQPAFDQWQQASGLTLAKFDEFAKALELEFGFSFPTIEEVDVYASRRDSMGLYYYFQAKVAEAKQSNKPIIISEGDLKDYLGKERFEQRNVHYFRVPDWYCPITPSVEELEAALERFESGYIALIGSPGSGKSSLLTRTLVESPREERIVRYYAYVPAEREYGAPPRGEAVNFFQDVTQQLERYGFQVGERLPELNLDLLRERLGLQCQRLTEDYTTSGRKTVILVDGLDHIAREQQDHVDRTLLAELPAPSQVPPGIILILGSQHLQDLPDAVLAQLREDNRVIGIQPLSPQQTSEVLEVSGVWGAIQREAVSVHRDETGAILQDIYGLTQGHPLALAYLLNQLIDAARAGASLLEVLRSAIPYDGDIDAQYWTHWRQIEREYAIELRDLVGLASRLRGPIDFQWLRQTWPERQAIGMLELRFRHFFRRNLRGHWQFFHNSFKQFLLARSVETIDGRDPMEEARFHQILAERCQAATDHPLVHWETLFHFWKAKRYEETCDVATREFFEQQLFALRPLDEIINDARLPVVAAARLHDAVRMFRALFILSEYVQRSYELEHHDNELLEILIDLGEVDKTSHWLLDGQKLRVRDSLSRIEDVQKKALGLSIRLAQAGFVDEGQQLFGLAEPLHLLRGGKPISTAPHRENLNVLEAWVDAAAFYRKTSDVITQVRALECELPKRPSNESEKQPTRLWQNYLLRELGASLIALGKCDNALEVAQTYDLQQEPRDRWYWFWIYRGIWWAACDQGQQDLAKQLIGEACSVFELDTLRGKLIELRSKISLSGDRNNGGETHEESTRYAEANQIWQNIRAIQRLRVALAQDIYLICQDEDLATAWIEDIKWPELPGQDYQVEGTLDTLDTQLILYSLLHALGNPLPQAEAIIPDRRQSDSGKTILARTALLVARLRGDRWTGKPYQPYEYRSIASAVFRFHHIPRRKLKDPIWWPVSGGELASLFEWLIAEAAIRGDDALTLIRHELEKLWEDPSSQQYWYPYLRRRVLLAFLNYEATTEWADVEIRNLLHDEIIGEDINGHIEEALDRARIWWSLGNREQAINWVNNAVRASLGIGYRKDYQLDAWVGWLGRWNRLEPNDEAKRIEAYAHRAAALDQTTEGRAAQYAAMELLKVTREWSPSRAVNLFWWLFDQECLMYFSAVQEWVAWYARQAEQKPDLELVPAIALLNAICLPWWGKEEDNTSFTHLLHMIAKIEKERLKLEGQRMAQIISTESPAEVRAELLRGLAEVFREYDIDESMSVDDETKDTSRNDESVLILSSGDCLTLAEVIERVRDDYHALRNLIDNEQILEESHIRFPWGEVTSVVAKELETAEAIAELANHTRALEGHGANLPLAERAAEIGHTELAHRLAKSALAVSDPKGWSRIWDGGSKQRPYAILVHVDPSKYRAEAFEAFANDMEKDEARYSIAMLVQNLDELFSVFGTPDIELEVCKLVEEHVVELFKATPLNTEPLEFLYESFDGRDGPVESTIRLLMSHLGLPIPELRIRVLRALTEMYLEHPQLVIHFIRDGFSRSEEVQEHLLALCETVAQKDSTIVKPIVDTVRPLVHYEHFGIAETARRVLFLCGAPVPSLEPLVAIPASSLTNVIVVPNGPVSLSKHSLTPSHRERIAPFGPQVEALARASSIEEETAFRLCAQVLNEWEATPEKLEGQEEILRSRVLCVRLAYIRPRAAAARRTVHYLATRLRREGLLAHDDALQLSYRFLNHFDPDMVLWYPNPRANDILPIELADRTYKETWVEQLQEVSGLEVCPQRDAKDWSILAQSVFLKSSYHNCWECRHVTTISPRPGVLRQEIIDVSPMHLRTPGCLVSTYAQESCWDYRDDVVRLVFQPWTDWFETRGKDWISLRPDLMRHMGWQSTSNDPLSWQTEAGELMVRSFGWQDGTPSGERLSSEVGHGWRVIVSPDAWSALLPELPGHPWRVVEIQRGFEGEYEPRGSRRWCEQL